MKVWPSVVGGMAVLGLAVLPACGITWLRDDCPPLNEDEGDCINLCGELSQPLCVGGEWICQGGPECEECGALPEGEDCIDGCGNFQLPSCFDGQWVCPEIGDECQDPPVGGAVWSSSLGSDGYERAQDIAVDGDGNVYVIGSFHEILDTPIGSLTSAGGYDIFVAKFSPTGDPLWRVQRGAAGDDLGVAIGVDLAGAPVITGTQAATVGQPGVVGDLFLAKLSPSGDPIWELDFTGVEHEGYATTDNLAVDGFGYITITGRANAGTAIGAPLSADGIFVARFDPAGQPVWTQTFATGDSAMIENVATDLLGNTFVTGDFTGDVVLGADTLSASGTADAFLMALDASGVPLWARGFGAFNERSLGWRVAADGAGGVALSGSFGQAILIDGMLYSDGPRTAFVALFDPSGVSRWANAIRASDTISGWDRFSLAVDELGQVVVAGQFEGFSSVALPGQSAGDYDMFLARYSASGAKQWGWSFGDDNAEAVTAIATGPGQTTAVLGEFWGAPDLGTGQLESHSEGAIFIALFDEDGQR